MRYAYQTYKIHHNLLNLHILINQIKHLHHIQHYPSPHKKNLNKKKTSPQPSQIKTLIKINTIKTLHFNTNNINHNFINKLLTNTNIQLTFTNINQIILNTLNTHHNYQIHIINKTKQINTISNINTINNINNNIINLITQINLITTTINPIILKHITPTITKKQIKHKKQNNKSPLNIITYKNIIHNTTQLKNHIINTLPKNTKT